METDRITNHIKQILGSLPAEFIIVSVQSQTLTHFEAGMRAKNYLVSTSRLGIGNRENSMMTPAGLHRIAEKYGHNAPLGRIFRDRIDTGENWPIGSPGENLILTRILRLEGMQEGINRGPGIDSFERYIYIHGTNNEKSIGLPASHGCVCMKNDDIIELFDLVLEGTIVFID